MSLIEKINQDFQLALKEQKQTVVSTLRLLKSEMTKKEKEGKGFTEEMAAAVLKAQIKQRKESIVEYQKAGRQDLVDQEQTELAILETYAPKQMSEDEVAAAVETAIGQLPAEEQTNFGKVMSQAMKITAGLADGAEVSRLVKEKLGQ